MTKVTIIPENPGVPNTKFRASSRDLASIGSTPGAALDALTEQLPESETGTIVIVQSLRPDQFFSASQQKRLRELMDKLQEARASKRELDGAEQAELEQLIKAEMEASARRADAIASELPS